MEHPLKEDVMMLLLSLFKTNKSNAGEHTDFVCTILFQKKCG